MKVSKQTIYKLLLDQSETDQLLLVLKMAKKVSGAPAETKQFISKLEKLLKRELEKNQHVEHVYLDPYYQVKVENIESLEDLAKTIYDKIKKIEIDKSLFDY